MQAPRAASEPAKGSPAEERAGYFLPQEGSQVAHLPCEGLLLARHCELMKGQASVLATWCMRMLVGQQGQSERLLEGLLTAVASGSLWPRELQRFAAAGGQDAAGPAPPGLQARNYQWLGSFALHHLCPNLLLCGKPWGATRTETGCCMAQPGEGVE